MTEIVVLASLLGAAPTFSWGQATGPLPVSAALDSALFQHATAVLERDGTTFYALGVYRDSVGEVLQFTPAQWPRLSAPAEEWEDSLRKAMTQLPPAVHLAAVLIDQSRAIADAGSADGLARRWIGWRGGDCASAVYSYRWDAQGRVRWDRAGVIPCVPWPADSTETLTR